MTTRRNIQAEITREKILEASAEEIYRAGFRAASLNEILKKLGISKGALYHHFPDKNALGYAVVDELYAHRMEQAWAAALNSDDPLRGIAAHLRRCCKIDDEDTLKCGCPINNLAQEMSPIDEGFRERIERIYDRWHKQMMRAFIQAQRDGIMRRDVDPGEVAYFVIATTQGAIGLAKNAQNGRRFEDAINGLIRYLEGLRADTA
jgi:AcrR family transcriptional regulator